MDRGIKLIKYLYGKSKNLGNFADTGYGLWFRDLFSMSKLENEKISDDEASKSIQLAPDAITKFIIDGRDFKIVPNNPIVFSQSPNRCHVLCLSNKGNCDDLFQRFDADICIGINVIEMKKYIKDANSKLGLKVVMRPITYYENDFEISIPTQDDLVFFKPKTYMPEDEFRIAIFWPKGESTQLLTESDGFVNIFSPDIWKDDHIAFEFWGPAYEKVVDSVMNRQLKAS
jgi:hypothetical protein